MNKFFSRLSYSLGNEDWQTESDALKIQPLDKILCITASGDRPLNLLMQDCQEIVCIDANPIQNYLLELKIAAMQIFEYEDYLAFLGVKNHKNRLKSFKHLEPLLTPAAKEFWLKHPKMIAKGILYQGAVERLTKVIALVSGTVRRKTIKKLFAFTDLKEQQEFVKKHWDRKWWRKVFELALNPSISPLVIEDPGLVNVGATIKPGTYIYERILVSLNQCLASHNPLFSLIFQGHLAPEAFPPYLTPLGSKVIKNRLNRIKIHTGEAAQYLETFSTPYFNAFSLSDIASYMSHAHFVRLLQAVYKTAHPNARFCIRQFLSSQQIPQEFQAFFFRDSTLEKYLEFTDRCFLYRFIVGTILNKSELNKEIANNSHKVTEKILCNQN